MKAKILALVIGISAHLIASAETFVPYCTEDYCCPEECYCWHFDVDLSFIYWRASQRLMDMGATRSTTTTLVQGETAIHPFEFKPGFQVGLGWWVDCCWEINAEYTRLHQTTTGSFTTPPGSSPWDIDDWFLGFDVASNNLLESKWRMDLDMLDVVTRHSFCVCNTLLLTPFAGLRAFWIGQEIQIASGSAFSDLTSRVWAIGPYLGGRGSVALCKGLTLEGILGASLNYTRFTKVNVRDVTHAGGPLEKGSFKDLGTGSPTLNTGIGLGWGTDCFCGRILLACRYDLLYIWNQNVLRELCGMLFNSARPIGNLTLQGLTVTGTFIY